MSSKIDRYVIIVRGFPGDSHSDELIIKDRLLEGWA